VIAARAMLYYVPRYKGFSRPWVSVKNAIASLADDGAIVPEDVAGTRWYHLPRVKAKKLADVREAKIAVYRAWDAALGRAGTHAEVLWRLAFRQADWVVPIKPTLVPCPDPAGSSHASEHEIDVFATLPGRYSVACEVKNGPGEGWLGPDIIRDVKLTDAQKNIRHHFRSMAALGLTPMLAAPFVDPSFYPFQAQHNGVHARYLYHVFHPTDAATASLVREVFRIGHVWSEPEPPPNFHAFVQRLPGVLNRLQDADDRWEEAASEAAAGDEDEEEDEELWSDFEP
jgi:hypothetical protein